LQFSEAQALKPVSAIGPRGWLVAGAARRRVFAARRGSASRGG